MIFRTRKKRASKGFTILELLISISIASVLTLVLVTVTVYYYGDILRSQATAELAIESQTVLRKIIDDTRLADGIRTTNQITDANAPVGGWVTNDPSNILIIATPAITTARDIIYDSSSGQPYENENIYFQSNGVFYRRSLKNTAAVGNIIVTTCPAASASASCPRDSVLSTHLTDLSFTFYDINNTTTSNAANARSIAVTVNIQRKVYGINITFNNTIRTTLRNY